MKRLNAIQELAEVGRPLSLAMGVFDGVHLGHRAVIAAAVEDARRGGHLAGVLTFDPHPLRVLAPERAPRSLLASLDHKARLLTELGVEVMLVLPFDQAQALVSAEDFLSNLLRAGEVVALAVGEDWRFGHQRRGDVAFLDEQSGLNGYRLLAMAAVMCDGERVSSTRIRQAIRDGAMSQAAAMLGRPYSIQGEVVRGRQLARQLGFPTANVRLGEEQLPPDGVWLVRARWQNEWWDGVANLGVRPTLGDSVRQLEVHVLDVVEDLYGCQLEVEFCQWLRGEQKFESIAALEAQIRMDIATSRGLLR